MFSPAGGLSITTGTTQMKTKTALAALLLAAVRVKQLKHDLDTNEEG